MAPDQTLSPDYEFGPAMESERGLLFPVAAYALMENALRFSRGLGVSEQQHELAALGAAMSAVAADNVDAWQREPLTVADFAPDATGNRPLAFPYTKRHASQWTVDQAAGLIFCSAAVARELGVPPERWLFRGRRRNRMRCCRCRNGPSCTAAPERHWSVSARWNWRS